ncbi:hypothetical protein CGJ43_00080 [Vibrio parahaemolyticus]|uniref:hypothetical protein n=1 Tax=Vibrio parahaemolyticus TaxID=670 RepID=UPI00111DFCC6|nr:hypothetical protein [Vibrio parahaemolyticus]MBE4278847.1 hypothetical protein [Vibrio parahaemolyticus]TOE43882.1 hypothetical protein CGJ43_00080 [Vibrio parahaemolyticus]
MKNFMTASFLYEQWHLGYVWHDLMPDKPIEQQTGRWFKSGPEEHDLVEQAVRKLFLGSKLSDQDRELLAKTMVMFDSLV